MIIISSLSGQVSVYRFDRIRQSFPTIEAINTFQAIHMIWNLSNLSCLPPRFPEIGQCPRITPTLIIKTILVNLPISIKNLTFSNLILSTASLTRIKQLPGKKTSSMYSETFKNISKRLCLQSATKPLETV